MLYKVNVTATIDAVDHHFEWHAFSRSFCSPLIRNRKYAINTQNRKIWFGHAIICKNGFTGSQFCTVIESARFRIKSELSLSRINSLAIHLCGKLTRIAPPKVNFAKWSRWEAATKYELKKGWAAFPMLQGRVKCCTFTKLISKKRQKFIKKIGNTKDKIWFPAIYFVLFQHLKSASRISRQR